MPDLFSTILNKFALHPQKEKSLTILPQLGIYWMALWLQVDWSLRNRQYRFVRYYFPSLVF